MSQIGDDLDAKSNRPRLSTKRVLNHLLFLFVGGNDGNEEAAFFDKLSKGRMILTNGNVGPTFP
jgi:hypothetical protein